MVLHTLAILCLALSQSGRPDGAPFQEHLDPRELARVDQAIARGRTWLREQQGKDGSFRVRPGTSVCPVALTAMGLWAFASVTGEPDESMQSSMQAAARFLLAHRQPDGGIYDPAHGLAIYTSGVALQALRTLELPDSEETLAGLELFVYRARAPESLADAEQDAGRRPDCAEKARGLLRDARHLSPEEVRALKFLALRDNPDSGTQPFRTRQPGWKEPGAELGPFSYEDVLPFVYLPLEPSHPSQLRAQEALRRHYQIERNPDLTSRYGPAGFLPGDQGLYYYYLLVAKSLSLHGLPWIELQNGERHDWVREISAKLLSLQRPPGYWHNDDPHWWESEPVLTTSYALMTLRLCREMLARD